MLNNMPQEKETQKEKFEIVNNKKFDSIKDNYSARDYFEKEELNLKEKETWEDNPIAIVINNNQKGWENIVETKPFTTLDVGEKLYSESQVREEIQKAIEEERSRIYDFLEEYVSNRGLDAKEISNIIFDNYDQPK